MKKIIGYTSLCLLLANAGCNKFLDKNPDNRADLNTPDKVSQLLGTAYPQANYMGFFESISDNARDKGQGSVVNTNQDIYMFKDTEASDGTSDCPEFYWDGCYAAIAAANQAIAAIKASGDSASYTAQLGEALVCRAYAHFMLVNVFSKSYDSTTASQDAGIPYVTEPENVVNKQYDRKTVAYVYDMVEKDLLQGLPLLNDNAYSVPKYHFTKMAANAFAARYYLFKKQWAKVVAYASDALGGADIVTYLRPWNTTYLTYTYNVLWSKYERATEPANLLLVETQSVWARNYYSVRYSIDNYKRDEIFPDPAQVSGGSWAFRNQLYTAGTNNYMIPKINEYFVKESINAQIGTPYVMVPLFTAEELLFNRAEANAYLGDTTASVNDLNKYLSTRIRLYDPAVHAITATAAKKYFGVSTNLLGLVNAVLAYKRAEFAFEGMRWLDLQRYKLAVSHDVVQNGQVIQTLTLKSDALQRVFQIPSAAKLSGVAQNPR